MPRVMTSPSRGLIVEDEPLIAMMLEDFLDMLDHEVVGTADCCAEALSLLKGGRIDAAILDVNLRGGERSWPVADALAALGVPFVVATGGDEESVEVAHRGRPRLQKPFTMDHVERAMAALA